MTEWICKVDIKQHLGTETSNEAVRTAAGKIFAELKANLPKEWISWAVDDPDYELLHILQSLEFAQDDEDMECDHFNYILSELYDWADSKRVWIGL